ncbi:serine protease inhibitor ecotin [Shewanella sp. D64]|uniref:serine protease inhibitor ecotin n=1 Tax=unclassified Shewanella TaxID=196818 RepID=UPI0022BA5736|nr:MULTISPECIES: serine protease inhibitor ecotin [unclassified Shewanella]MEC4725239.1 serine protease inhibitor ecotin [Shewanella sp. D64]MEC4735915.1 serine protease inhibitor ecotin [Shewanella sp. E94]WBJ93118.1 serine protease inhibitor ecotin [Shewanella sp. MTB7]
MLTVSSTLTTKRIIASTALAISLFSFNSLATSPVQPSGQNQNMIVAQTFTPTNYKTFDDTKMFPAPSQGMEQHILTLPKLDNETDYIVEIQIGETRLVDCNKHGLSGKLIEHTVKGWGYNYYQVDHINPGPSTKMACFDKAKTEAFLSIPGELKIQYDSRLPKVFYLPLGSELRYRVWSVESEFSYSMAK